MCKQKVNKSTKTRNKVCAVIEREISFVSSSNLECFFVAWNTGENRMYYAFPNDSSFDTTPYHYQIQPEHFDPTACRDYCFMNCSFCFKTLSFVALIVFLALRFLLMRKWKKNSQEEIRLKLNQHNLNINHNIWRGLKCQISVSIQARLKYSKTFMSA